MARKRAKVMKNDLEELFGSKERWRLIKLFVLNDSTSYSLKDIVARNKMDWRKVRSIMLQLKKAKLIKESTRRNKKFYSVNPDFPFFSELKKLVVKSNIYPQCASLGRIKNLGDVKLGLVTGIFLDDLNVKVDLLIVADHVSNAKMKHLLEDLEIEVGREIHYSLMTLAEFKYRVNMFDKFILDLLEGKHEIVVNKIQNEIRMLKRIKKNNNVF